MCEHDDEKDVQRILNYFSGRELQTLARLFKGGNEKTIAAELGISPNTVHVHIKSLFQKARVSSKVELVGLFVPTTVATQINERISASPQRATAAAA